MNNFEETGEAAEVIAYSAPKTQSQLKQYVDQFLELTRENTEEAQKDRDYFDGDQISASVRAELEKRGQPPIYTNKIAPAINGILGLIDSEEVAIEAYPRSFRDKDAADTATKVLRYLSERARFQTVKERCSENFFIDGSAAAVVEFDGEQVTVERIRFEDFIYDPLSREHNFSDSKYLGIGKLMDRDDVEALFGDEFSGSGANVDDPFDFQDDRSKRKQWWGLTDRSSIRVVDLYYEVGGQWHRAIFTGSEILFAGPSDYLDELGRSQCPIHAASFEVSRNGDRYGPIRNMRPVQDEVNARRSKLLHLLNHRQVHNTHMGGAANREEAVRQAAKADGALPFGWEAMPTTDMAQGQMTIYQQSHSDLDRMAPSPAVLGRGGGANESGRARMILQQAGKTELARQFGRFEEMELSLYRSLWTTARQYLQEPIWIRITDDPRTMDFMQINVPIVQAMAQPVVGEDGQPQIDPMTGAPVVEIVSQVVGKENEIAQLDMDIILSTVPNPLNLEMEVFKMLMDWAGATKQSPFAPEFQAMLEIAPLPNRRETLERIKAAAAELQGGEPDPMQQAALQMGMEKEKAGIAKDMAKAEKDTASAKATQFEIASKAFGQGSRPS